MTSDLPPSPDGSALPPRHRPNMGSLSKDTTETDLWSFDDPASGVEPLPPSPRPVASKPQDSAIPLPRSTDKSKLRRPTEDVQAASAEKHDSIRTNIGRKRTGEPTGSPMSAHLPPAGDFGDLDRWDEPEDATSMPTPAPLAPLPVEQTRVVETVDHGKFEEFTMEEGMPTASAEAVAPPVVAEDEEFKPRPRENTPRASLRPKLGLSKIELIGLCCLGGLLLVVGGLLYFNTIHRLPRVTENLKSHDFPVVGKHVTLDSAVTYWREPVTEGAQVDTVRRDTALLPEVIFKSSGGAQGAIRVFFRDADGKVVGDAVTRPVRAGESIRIAATAGFDDPGMHAAYRIGDGKRWTIEVLEAPSENAAAEAFKRLFIMNVASDRR